MGPDTLAQVLQPVRSIFNPDQFPDLIVGLEVSDDAAVYKINDDLAIISTLDFFTPVVDDPYTYGAIAAANSLSDVYAMGGEVMFALNIAGFPCSLKPEIVGEILRGGAEKIAESGGVLAGGHTIQSKEPMFGLSVIGKVHPNRIFTKSNARPGDKLILTKPLGVGIITTAAKGDAAEDVHLNQAIASMQVLNKNAAGLLQNLKTVCACTDITGFSLLGHSSEIAEKSGVKIVLDINALPFLPGAKEYAMQWLFPAGSCTNEECYKQHITFSPDISRELQMLLYTPETSGGLLASIHPEEYDTFTHLFENAGQQYWCIGEVKDGCGIDVV